GIRDLTVTGVQTCALPISTAGWLVCFSYLEAEDEARSVVTAVRGEGGHAQAFRADIASEPDVVSLFETALALGPVRGFVANAAEIGRASCREGVEVCVGGG